MGPREVLLEVLDDGRWSFEGDYLVGVDREGSYVRVAVIMSGSTMYPAKVEFLNDTLPNVTALSEAHLRGSLEGLSRLEAFRYLLNRPRP